MIATNLFTPFPNKCAGLAAHLYNLAGHAVPLKREAVLYHLTTRLDKTDALPWCALKDADEDSTTSSGLEFG
jgi:hypothetical protein